MNKITVRFISPKYAIYSIHGEHIEPGSNIVAEAIAGHDLSFYSAKGEQHIPSSAYNEPKALELASKVNKIISVHGEHETNKAFVMVGGLDKPLTKQIENELKTSGFDTITPPDGLNGDNPENICNKGQSGMGIQIEISKKLREELHRDKNAFSKFIEAVRRGLFA